MSYAILLRETGGPDKLRYEAVEVADPGPGEILIRHTVIGVNFHDSYVRSGLYNTLKLPGIPGLEGAAVVEKVGPGVSGFAVGDRIAYIDTSYGAYSQRRLLSAGLALRLPNSVTDEAAASLTIKGFTACMLLRKVHAVCSGETLLIHAAAGGVGQPLVRWAKHLGANDHRSDSAHPVAGEWHMSSAAQADRHILPPQRRSVRDHLLSDCRVRVGDLAHHSLSRQESRQ